MYKDKNVEREYHRRYRKNHREHRLKLERGRYKRDPNVYKKKKAERVSQWETNPKAPLLSRAKQLSKRRGEICTLTLDDIQIPVVCPILGKPFDFSRKNGLYRKNTPSVDRIDNNKGYTKDNVWIISRLANTMKNCASREELIQFGKWTATLEQPINFKDIVSNTSKGYYTD